MHTTRRFGTDMLVAVRSSRNDLTSQRQDVARRLRPLIASWESDVDAEAAANSSGATR